MINAELKNYIEEHSEFVNSHKVDDMKLLAKAGNEEGIKALENFDKATKVDLDIAHVIIKNEPKTEVLVGLMQKSGLISEIESDRNIRTSYRALDEIVGTDNKLTFQFAGLAHHLEIAQVKTFSELEIEKNFPELPKASEEYAVQKKRLLNTSKGEVKNAIKNGADDSFGVVFDRDKIKRVQKKFEQTPDTKLASQNEKTGVNNPDKGLSA